MYQLLKVFFIILLLSSCKSSKEEEKFVALMNSHAALFDKMADEEKMKIRNRFTESPSKHEKKYILSEKNEKIKNNFENAFNEEYDFETLNSIYNEKRDSISQLISFIRNKRSEIEKVSFTEKTPFYKSAMLLEISKLHFNVNSILYRYSDAPFCGYYSIDVKVKNETIVDYNYFSSLSSIGIPLSPKKTLLLDTILLNGRKIKSPFVYENNYSFMNLKADSLKKGKYELKGFVLFSLAEGLVDKKRFIHEFEVK